MTRVKLAIPFPPSCNFHTLKHIIEYYEQVIPDAMNRFFCSQQTSEKLSVILRKQENKKQSRFFRPMNGSTRKIFLGERSFHMLFYDNGQY